MTDPIITPTYAEQAIMMVSLLHFIDSQNRLLSTVLFYLGAGAHIETDDTGAPFLITDSGRIPLSREIAKAAMELMGKHP